MNSPESLKFKYGFYKIAFTASCAFLFLIPNDLFAQSKFLHAWEMQITNSYSQSIEITFTDVALNTTAYNNTIEASTSEQYSFGAVGGGYIWDDGLANNLYKIDIDIDVDDVITSYHYVSCQAAPSSMDFYCPNTSTANADFDFVVLSSGHISVVPGGFSPTSGSTDLTTHFSDDDWIVPYNLDTYCGSAGINCASLSRWFLTPQATSSTSYTFSSVDLVQPTDEDWDFTGKTISIPTGKTMTINKGLTIASSTSLKFENDSAMIYDGTDNNFNVAAGSTILLGDDVRLTFESKIKLTGTSGSPITFSPLAGGDRWDYLDLKADGNDFDYVVFDKGDKTVEVRSDDNTFDYVTFKNGNRGISSYLATGGGRSSFSLNHVTIENNGTVGLTGYFSDYSMMNSVVQTSGQAGIWMNSSESTSFTNNVIEGNGINSSWRSGIEVSYSSNLDTGENAHNAIKNNEYHEVESEGSATVNLGLVVSAGPGGSNDIFDTDTPDIGEKYVEEEGTYAITAEKNCWNTTSTPSSAWFSGTVDYDPWESCSGLSKSNISVANIELSLKEKIQQAQRRLESNAPFYNARDVSALYSIQTVDFGDKSQEQKSTYSLIKSIAYGSAQTFGPEAEAARERALLILIMTEIKNDNLFEAADLITSSNEFIQSASGQIELLFLQVSFHELTGSFFEAVKVIALIEQHKGYSNKLRSTLDLIKENISQRLKEDGVGRQTFQFEKPIVKPDSKDLFNGIVISTHPNPFNPTTLISFKLSEASSVRIEIFNVLGQLVNVVVHGQLAPSYHQYQFNANNLPSGTYFLKSQINDYVLIKKLVLTK